MRPFRMQRRIHKTFGRPLAQMSSGLGCAAVLCLGVGLAVERFGPADGPAPIFYLAFLGCAAALPLYTAWASERGRCPKCDQRMIVDSHRDPSQELWFTCSACEIEWRTRTVVDL